ncbi:MAG TPA: chorismate synthase [Bacteroidales bacterium]|nr:chorismate synthase [Bacteroidales bacterium]
MSNVLGDLFKLSIYGDSHGKALGGVLDGCPPGLAIDEEQIGYDLKRRKSGHDFFSSPRSEDDRYEILSGIRNGKTTGGPIGFIIYNSDFQPDDYRELDSIFRPSHADFTYFAKYGSEESAGKLHASARIFAPVVLAGAIAKQVLLRSDIRVSAFVRQIGTVSLDTPYTLLDLSTIEQSPVRCPDKETSEKMLRLLKNIKKAGDSTGGVITGVISGCPPGVGDPVFDKLQARLAHAMFSINAVKGFEYGSGFDSAAMTGSTHNDLFIVRKHRLRTKTNNSGGIQGGISNGEDIYFNVAFKPVPGIRLKQKTVDRNADYVEFATGGRHDICFVPRAVPVVEAMSALVLADSYLKHLVYAEKY